VSQEVLIVEDDRALARGLVRTIEQAGYSTRLAHDGEAAMREVAKGNPDLLLLDLLIPKKDGRTVLTILQAAEATRSIPVLAMSGIFRGREHERELAEAGAAGFLEKPFSSERVLSELGRLLGAPTEAPKVERSKTGRSKGKRISLAERSVAEVLWDATQREFSGAVHFESGRHQKVVVLERGELRLIRSNAVRECLGQRLLDSGRVDQQTLEEVMRRAENSQRKQGEVLVAMGVLTRGELNQALTAQGEEKLLELFTWKEGEVWTQPGVLDDSLASPIEGWSPRRTILRGAERMDRDLLAARLAPHAKSAVTREKLELSPDETSPALKALLRVLEPDTQVGALMTHAPALYGLWIIGAVRLGGKKAPRARGALASPDELRAILESLGQQTHFEVLRVSRDMPPEKMRRAFVKQAKRYHPDRFRGASSELASLAAEIFARISAAHDTLSDARAREVYLEELRTGKSAEEQRREIGRIVSAEKECRKGEECLRRREHEQAVRHFQSALKMDPKEGEFHAFYGWSLFLTKREDAKAAAEAVEALKRALTLAPASPTGYYYLGQLRKACGELDQAARMFRKVLELRPEHVEASRELRLLQKRRDEPTGGLFGLGRKKK